MPFFAPTQEEERSFLSVLRHTVLEGPLRLVPKALDVAQEVQCRGQRVMGNVAGRGGRHRLPCGLERAGEGIGPGVEPAVVFIAIHDRQQRRAVGVAR